MVGKFPHSTFNGTVTWISSNSVATIVTDACGFAGGAFYEGDFVYSVWEVDYPDVTSLPINYKEAMMAALSVIRWAPKLTNTVVNVFTDNKCAAAIINRCACRSPVVMDTLRNMFWEAARGNFTVVARIGWGKATC